MTQNINLAPLRIISSKRLWQLQLLTGLMLALLSLGSTLSVVRDNTLWFIPEVGFIIAISLWLKICFKQSISPPSELRVYAGDIFLKILGFDASNKNPLFPQQFTETPVSLCGENLIWPWIIILNFCPVNQQKNNKKVTLVILQDSCNAEDWRRLRVYLLTQLD